VDRFSTVAIRASLVWLVAGFGAGAAMLTDRALPGAWRVWLAPTHGHALFVGWFVQFTVGVAYWLLARRRPAERPLGYPERAAFAALAALNLGLLLRVGAEPAERAGRSAAWTAWALVGSGALQVAAVAVFAVHLWSRVGARTRGRPAPR